MLPKQVDSKASTPEANLLFAPQSVRKVVQKNTRIKMIVLEAQQEEINLVEGPRHKKK